MSGSVRDTIGVAQPCVMRGPAPGNCSGSWRSPTGGTQANARARSPEAQRVTTLSGSYSRKQIQRYKVAGVEMHFTTNQFIGSMLVFSAASLHACSSTRVYPLLSSDAGGRIAFQSDRDGNAEIYMMNADGREPINL